MATMNEPASTVHRGDTSCPADACSPPRGRSLAFRVKGMDCAEEVAVLKREVGPLVGGEENLVFDVLTGRMTVLAAPPEVGEEAVARAVGRTGMAAERWREEGEEPPPEGWWERHGRTLLCAASGLLLVTGFAVHALTGEGLLAALGAGEASPPPLSIVLYLAALVAGAGYVAPKALYAARALRPDMNLLMIVAMAGAVGLGEWLEAASVAFLFALALLLERWSVGRARRAIEALLELAPQTARVVEASGETVERPVAEVAVGARVRVRPGEKVPLDGVVTSGETAVDQAPITGESIPVAKAPGDELFAGTVNGDGALEMEVTRGARDTTLARIIHMVEEAQARRAPSEQWVERFARIYTPVMMGLAVAVAVLPPLLGGGDWGRWFYQALVLLVIACPCALVISTPVTIVAALAAAARAGVLIKGGSFLEVPARLRVVALDKTGTLTWGRPRVQRVIPLNGHSEEELLARAAALEAESNHPLARAIVGAAQQRGVAFQRAEGLTSIPGKGAEGRLEGRRFWIGSHRFLEEQGAETPEQHRLAVSLEDAGHSVVAVGNDGHLCGLLSVADEPRSEAAAAVRGLRAAGVERVVLLTGDNAGTARAVAEAIGADEHRAELLPEDKVAAVRELAQRYGRVAMVGDGVNDAPALAASDAGIAMGAAGTDAAIETADIALMSDALDRLPWLVRHSRRALAVIRQNVVFALGLKLAFILLAGFGLATLWMAIAADMGASLLVIANALRLLRG